MASGRSCGSAGCGDDDGTCASELTCWESSDSKSPNPSPPKTMSVDSPPPSSWAVDVVDDAPTPVLEDESSEEKSPVPEKGFFHSESPPTLMGKSLARDQRAQLKIIGDDIYGWGYHEEGDEKGDMEAWAKCDDDFYIPIPMILPPLSGPKKCSLCEGDHHTFDCNYMDTIPPGTKIANTQDYVILCACGGLSEDGRKCDNIDCVSCGVSHDGGKSRPWPPRWVIPRDVM